PSGKNIIRWLLKKRTNGSVRYCQYTSSYLAYFYRIVVGINERLPALDQDEHWLYSLSAIS
ncbi:hypothetical protein C9081_25155, partial [Escherichia coli]